MKPLLLSAALVAGSVVALHDTPQRPAVNVAPSLPDSSFPQEASRGVRRVPLEGQKKRRVKRERPQHRQPNGTVLVVTEYCYTGSRNAAGKWPTVGTAAANAYPLGTRLYVEGVGVVVVEDRSAPGATDVDLYGGSDAGCEARAVAWGRRYLEVREAA